MIGESVEIGIVKKRLFVLLLLSFTFWPQGILAQEEAVPDLGAGPANESIKTEHTCAVYFTGIGCPHCAVADPVVFQELPREYPHLVLIEYEIYQERENAPLLLSYHEAYRSGLGVPLIIFGPDRFLVGDKPIVQEVKGLLKDSNPCPLADGTVVNWADLDLTTLPGKPKIWSNERLLTNYSQEADSHLLKNLLTTEKLTDALDEVESRLIKPEPAPFSGTKVTFDNAVEVGGGVLQWSGPAPPGSVEAPRETPTTTQKAGVKMNDLTVAKILSLAAVDAVNPCALAVLTLMLIAIVAYHPGKRREVLLAGLAFTFSVFVMYIIYGLVIIRCFQLVQAVTQVRVWLYKILGTVALGLGALNLKDFLAYKPGSLGTEMPLALRPKLKKLLAGVTSPRGALGVGAFVTVFLLPCTIGPYVITGGLLCALSVTRSLPWLFFYNAVFVSPMLAITLAVFLGLTKAENVGEWKEKNIRYLHLVAGGIMMALGVGIILGLF